MICAILHSIELTWVGFWVDTLRMTLFDPHHHPISAIPTYPILFAPALARIPWQTSKTKFIVSGLLGCLVLASSGFRYWSPQSHRNLLALIYFSWVNTSKVEQWSRWVAVPVCSSRKESPAADKALQKLEQCNSLSFSPLVPLCHPLVSLKFPKMLAGSTKLWTWLRT